MNRTLGPRNLGDILSETFAIYKNNFPRFAAIVASVQVPLIIVTVIVVFTFMAIFLQQGGIKDFEDIFRLMYAIIPAYILVVLVSFVAGVLMQGALIHAVSEQYLQQPVNIGRAFRFTWRRMRNTLGATLLGGLAVTGILLTTIGIPAAIYFATTRAINLELIVLAISLAAIGIPAAIYLGITWTFAIYAALLEGCSPIAALSHSAALVKQSWWRVLGIMILLTLIVLAINVVISFVPVLGGIIAAILSPPITAIGATLLYFDLRVRKQGYSLDALANELGFTSAPADTGSSLPG
jgi:hypothetical protein